MDGKSRICYVVSKGNESFEGYLFTDNVKFWESRGWSVVRSRIQVH